MSIAKYYCSCEKYSKSDEWILQISSWSFGSHNKKAFPNKVPKYKIQSRWLTLLSNPKTKNMLLIP